MYFRKIFLMILFFCEAAFCTAESEIIKKLCDDGFPHDYAVQLAPLQKKYPQWTFYALNITKLDKKYDWAYIIYQETDAAPSRSLISGEKSFAPYFHNTDTKLYDAHCRRASVEAVAYFLDPRNFLNERDIFQFEALTYHGKLTPESVKNALKNSFMENGTLENGKSYAEYFYEIGIQLKINPVFLASRAKQEQGLSGTPLISGKCGTMMFEDTEHKKLNNKADSIPDEVKNFTREDFIKYDGLYNFFNIKATSDRRFLIHLKGMQEAQTGTPEMTEIWGAPQWNTKWKSIYGGALKIAEKYVHNHQNTRYFQKWNVDPHSIASNGTSRNFWGQYMQNIGAAFSEAVTTYNALKKQNLIELPFTFIIPVYDNMPQTPSPDPAHGKCVFYRKYQLSTNNTTTSKKETLL